MDDLEQYNRRENLKIYDIPKSSNNKDNGEDTLLEIAEMLNMELDNPDIQRTHRLGTKRR